MIAYIDDENYSATESPESFAKECMLLDGQEFALIHVQVISRSEYRMVNGKPVQMSIAFPDGGFTFD